MKFSSVVLTVASVVSFVVFMSAPSFSEDCTTVLPSTSCTLDEDTTAALTIDDTVILTVGASININHAIDTAVNAGTIDTSGTGITVIQNVVIGGTRVIDSIQIGDGDTWTAFADILTNANGGDVFFASHDADIDLGTADGGETLNLNNGITVLGTIDGDAGDFLNIGSDLNGGTFSLPSSVDNIEVNIDSGNVTTGSSIGLGGALSDLNIASGASIAFRGPNSVTSTIDLDGTVILGANSILTVSTYNADANNGTVVFELVSDGTSTDNGELRFTGGGPVDLSGMTVNVVAGDFSTAIPTGTLADVIRGNGGATTLPTMSDTSFLYDFSLLASGDNVDLVVDRANLNTAANSVNNAQAAIGIFNGLFDEGNEVVQATQQNLSNATNKAAFNALLESTRETMDLSVNTTSNFVTNKTIALAQERLDYLRKKGSGPTGRSAGDHEEDRGSRIWGQVFGATGDQETRGSEAGYDFDTTGFSVGADTGGLNDDLVIGASLTYAATDIGSSGVNKTKSNIDSYQVGLYGTYFMENDYFVNGTLVWGLNEINSVRHNVGGTSANAVAQYDGEQISAYVEVGSDYRDGHYVLTPSLMAQYSLLETENHRERGAQGMNIISSHDTVYMLEVGPKVNAMWEYFNDSGVYLVPELYAAYRYDIIGDSGRAVATYQAGGNQMRWDSFESQDHTFNLGTAVTLYDETWEMNMSYDYESKGDLSIHSGHIRGAYKF